MRRYLSRLLFGLRFRLLLLVMVACAPLVALTLLTAGHDRRQRLAEWKQHCERMMNIAATEEERLVEQMRQLMLTLAESAPVQRGNPNATKRFLDKIFENHPSNLGNLGVIDTNGIVLTSALPITTVTNHADRKFFREAVENRTFAVGNYPAGTLGKPTISFGYPVFSQSGELRSIVYAAVDLDYFYRVALASKLQLPDKSAWMTVDQNGTMLVRYPSAERWIGRQFPHRDLLATAVSQTNGVTEFVNTAGNRMIYAFATMPSNLLGADVVTLLGIPRSVLFAEADRTLMRNLTWFAIAAAIAFALGWVGSNVLLIRPVESLVTSTTRLASGDLTFRTGLRHGDDEIGHLARAFDQMAQALERREQEGQRARFKLQALSRRLVEVQESERRHLARELHDEIGQTLTVADMNLKAALQSPAHSANHLRACSEAIELLIKQVHDLSLNLRPAMLDDLGLESTLRWYTNRQAALTKMEAAFRADPLEERLDPAIETQCFRVAQEALTNVARHAKARRVTVELRKHNGYLHLSVRDDGVGFNVAAVRERAMRNARLGLISMEERAAQAGGGLEYKSAPGHGTEVRAWFPLKWRPVQS